MDGRRARAHRAAGLREATRARLWPVPVASVVLALALGVALPALDRGLQDRLPSVVRTLVFGGGASAARDVLAAVAGAFVTVTSLTFSLTVVSLQLASSQYSPRLLRSFVGDRAVQATLGLFLGAFVYALVVLRTVREATEGDGFVPRLSVSLSVLSAVAGAVVLVLFLAHLVRRIRVEPVLVDVHREAVEALRRTEPARPVPEELGRRRTGRTVTADRTGFVTTVDAVALVDLARSTGVVVDLRATPGRLVVRGEELARLLPDDPADPGPGDEVDDRLRAAVDVGEERSASQDATYGLRQLVDICLRALSASLNDPTTAVHALAHAADVTAELLEHGVGDTVLDDDDGVPRVVLRRPGVAEVLDLAVLQPLRYAGQDPVVVVALLDVLARAAAVVPTPADAALVLAARDRVAVVADGLRDDARSAEVLDAALARVVTPSGRPGT